MKHRTLLNTLRHVAIFLAVIALIGAAHEVSAQKQKTIHTIGPLVTQFGPSEKLLRMDFSGDQRADIAIREVTSPKWIVYAAGSEFMSVEFGASSDIAVPGDFDGDKVEDIAVLQSSDGLLNWHILQSSDHATVDVLFGLAGDVAVQGDYDGDGKVDPAVWRPSDGLWYILPSSTGEAYTLECGTAADKPVPADYDGDSIMDVAVYESQEHAFYFLASSNQSINEQPFGPFVMSRHETFVPADYDGDGRADFAMFNPSSFTWTILESRSGEYRVVNIQSNHKPCSPSGINQCTITEFALPADYDNDGKVDPAMWSSIDGMVFAVGSTDGEIKFATDPAKDMTPVSSFFMTK